MSQEEEKIWKYLQQNDFVAQNLFFYDKNNNDLDSEDIFFDDLDEYGDEKKDFINTTWLYRLWFDYSSTVAIGASEDGSAMSIDNEGQFGMFAGIFCNIPYKILKYGCRFMKNQTVAEYFQRYPDFKKALDIYEVWAKSEGIVLDPRKSFHDENGELFKDLEFFKRKK